MTKDAIVPSISEVLQCSSVYALQVVMHGDGWYGRRYVLKMHFERDIGPCKTLDGICEEFGRRFDYLLETR